MVNHSAAAPTEGCLRSLLVSKPWGSVAQRARCQQKNAGIYLIDGIQNRNRCVRSTVSVTVWYWLVWVRLLLGYLAFVALRIPGLSLRFATMLSEANSSIGARLNKTLCDAFLHVWTHIPALASLRPRSFAAMVFRPLCPTLSRRPTPRANHGSRNSGDCLHQSLLISCDLLSSRTRVVSKAPSQRTRSPSSLLACQLCHR